MFPAMIDAPAFKRTDSFPGPGSTNGFTLLEIMVSMAIIAIVLVSLFRMQAGNIMLAERIQFNAIAPGLARGKISEISMETGEISNDSGNFGDAFSGYSWESVVSEMQVVDETILSEQFAEKMKRLEVTISFGHRYTYTLVSWTYHEIDT